MPGRPVLRSPETTRHATTSRSETRGRGDALPHEGADPGAVTTPGPDDAASAPEGRSQHRVVPGADGVRRFEQRPGVGQSLACVREEVDHLDRTEAPAPREADALADRGIVSRLVGGRRIQADEDAATLAGAPGPPESISIRPAGAEGRSRIGARARPGCRRHRHDDSTRRSRRTTVPPSSGAPWPRPSRCRDQRRRHRASRDDGHR